MKTKLGPIEFRSIQIRHSYSRIAMVGYVPVWSLMCHLFIIVEGSNPQAVIYVIRACMCWAMRWSSH